MATEYVRHFGLAETPFGRNHDPRWLYLSTQHKEAILKARWTVEEHGGLALLRGDVGMGKSFLVEYLMTVWPAQFNWKCAKLQSTGSITSPRSLLAEILGAFGIEPAHTTREMAQRLEEWLLRQACEDGNTIVLFVDEAQSIPTAALPVLRDLLNLETREGILLQIILSAQTSIDQRLNRFPAMQSRIASVSTLEPLTLDETDAMLLHRFNRARAADPISICPADTVVAIHEHTGGVPRDILVITEGAMKEAFLRGCDQVRRNHVERAYLDLPGRRPRLARAA